jgi:hypothetical protein|tara:strand:+ start:5010 stop:5762 length:753 start_codon:yes stop_codon:yes gene_type:complete
MKKFKILFIILIGIFTSCDKNQGPETVDLELQFVPKFNNAIFSYETDSLIQSTTQDTLIFTRSDFLLSNFKLTADDGSVIKFENTYAFVKGASPDTIKLPLSIPSGNYVGISFDLGLDSAANHSDPSTWLPNHPLNPSLNNLHWGWTGGYVFAALEGYYQNMGVKTPWLYHIALNENQTAVNLSGDFDLSDFKTLEIKWNAEMLFHNLFSLRPGIDGDFTHSTNDNGLAKKLVQNLSTSFSSGSLINRTP